MDFLKRLLDALPHVEEWIVALHAEHRDASIRVTDAGFPRLASCFPSGLLSTARVVSTTTIPFPPVGTFGIPEFESMGTMQLAGITFGDVYFVHPSHATEGVHFHELLHVIQWRVLGVKQFLLTYGLGIAQYGYRDSPLEAIAFDLQSQFEAATESPDVADIVARHALETRDAAILILENNGLTIGGVI